MNILFVGDIFGDAGKKAVKEGLPILKSRFKIDFAVGNCENAVDGFGIDQKSAEELLGFFDVLTTGNHLFDQKQIVPYLSKSERLLRPLNYLRECPGKGLWIGELAGLRIAVINLIGQVYMAPVNSPFEAIDAVLEQIAQSTDLVFVDFHAEATGEKMAMAHYLDGRVAAVVGTHTHVQTADAQILPNGTAYITDLGMTGPYNSIIGMDKEMVLPKYRTGIAYKPKAATKGLKLCGALVSIDENSREVIKIEPIQQRIVS